MKAAAFLPDVNVLIALFDPAHPFHDAAHHWFGRHRKQGWATCPATVNGVVRILSNPAYPGLSLRPSDVIANLMELCTAQDHQFWPDSISLLDPAVFDHQLMVSFKHISDLALLALAVRHDAALVTFDSHISLAAVVGATAGNLILLKGSLPLQSHSPSSSRK